MSDAAQPETLMVVATYQPKPGHLMDLIVCLDAQDAVLRRQGLLGTTATTRLVCDDGSTLEIQTWQDDESRARAAVDPAVRAAWQAIEAVADTVHRVDVS